ncbi:MAG: peptidylprolyl isomerase [Saprospiraceae bacterium]
MLKQLYLFILAAVATGSIALAQEGSQILFSVDGNPVSVEEFDYIYSKTNGDTATYSRESLQEYLDLYKRFKLKVAKARDMGLDTVPSLMQELAGYRRQLSDSYLVDQEVTEPMARELYDRMQEDVNVLHIAIDLPKSPSEDTLSAYEKAKIALERVQGGVMWGKVARDFSTDPSAPRNGGEVGYITAPLPIGLYALENAIYETKPGELSGIVRSDKAYHIIKVLDRREARGEVEAAHIFLRKPKDADDAAVKTRIDSIYKALNAGAEFDVLAKTLSEDTRSAPRNGYIGFFGINRYERSFEDAAFGVNKDGGYGAPIETRVGWHIIKRISKRAKTDWNTSKSELVTRIKRLPRYEIGRVEMVERLKNEYNFTENKVLLNKYVESLPDSFMNYRWKPGPVDEVNLFTFKGDDREVKLSDFTSFLRRNASKRIRMEGIQSVEQAARSLYKDFVVDQTFLYAESRLDKDNPDFYNLMREYQEGILLFEATKKNVWDKAGQDTTGLEAFFAKNRGQYTWKERVEMDVYSMPIDQEKTYYGQIAKMAKKSTPEEILAKFNTGEKDVISHHTRTVERGREPSIDQIKWKKGSHTLAEQDRKRKVSRIGVIKTVLDPTQKELSEARGYVIADYQDQLEREWVAELEKTYEVRMNKDIFEMLIRS